MGTNYYMVRTRPTLDEPLHIGKNSYGWKFLFHYVYYNYEHEVSACSYDEWVNVITEKTNDGSYVILNEYEDIVEPEKFFEIVAKAQENNNPEDFKYNMNIDGYRFNSGEFS